jgi:hypothetical protein
MFGPDGMSIGLGIFLASLYLGTIYLYVQTRDRWNWSKLIARSGFLVVGGAMGAALIYGGIVGYETWQARPKVITGVGPVGAGDSWPDVVFKLGKFEEIKPESDPQHPDEHWYRHETLPLHTNVRQGRVAYVVYHCYDGDRQQYGPFNGIRCGDDGSSVLKAFGDKVRVLCRKQKDLQHLRVYDVVEYGTRYVMSSNKVSSVGVAQPALLATFHGINWDKCGVSPLEMGSPEEAKKADPSGALSVKVAPDPAKTAPGN